MIVDKKLLDNPNCYLGHNIQLSEVDMMMTKTIKTPLMTAVAFGLTSCPSGLVPKSELLHNPEVQYGFVPKHSLHGGKNIALRAEKLYVAVYTNG